MNYPYAHYFINYACYIRDFWLNIDRNYFMKDETMLKSSLEDNVDELMYLHDLAHTTQTKLKKMLLNAFLTYCVIPCILGSFTAVHKGAMSLNFALYVLYQIVSSVSDPVLVDALCTLLLRPDFLVSVENLMKNPVLDPADYSFQWSSSTKQAYEFSLLRYQFEWIVKESPVHRPIAEKEATPLSTFTLDSEYNAKILGASTYFVLPEAECIGNNPLDWLESMVEGRIDFRPDAKLVKYNMTRDIVASLFRSRDDNLVWLASALLHKLLQNSSPQIVNSTRILAKDSPNSLLFTIIKSIHLLLASETEFRGATVKSLGNLMLMLAKRSNLTLNELPEPVRKELAVQSHNKAAGLLHLLNQKSSSGIVCRLMLTVWEEFK